MRILKVSELRTSALVVETEDVKAFKTRALDFRAIAFEIIADVPRRACSL